MGILYIDYVNLGNNETKRILFLEKLLTLSKLNKKCMECNEIGLDNKNLLLFINLLNTAILSKIFFNIRI